MRQLVSFDNWIFAETGRRGPMAYHYGRRKLLASYGHWRGLNVIRYTNGGIGPRPPVANLNIGFSAYGTATTFIPPSTTTNYTSMQGDLSLALYNPATGWVCIFLNLIAGGTDIWATPVSPAVVANLPTPTPTTSYGVWHYIGNTVNAIGGTGSTAQVTAVVSSGTYILCFTGVQGTGFYFDARGPSTTPVRPGLTALPTTVPGANMAVAYKEFIVLGTKSQFNPNSGTGLNTLFFSDRPATIGTQPGLSWTQASTNTSIVAIGTNEPFTGLFVQKNTLAISKQGGEWYTMTGAWDNGTVRKADVGLDLISVGATIRESNIWYPNGRDIGTFTGATTNIEPLPDFTDTGASSIYYGNNSAWLGIIALEQSDEFMLVGKAANNPGQDIPFHFFIRHGAYGTGTAIGWTRHTIPYHNQKVINTGPISLPPVPVLGGYPINITNSLAWILFQNSVTNNVEAYQFDIRQEIPYEGPLGSFLPGDPRTIYADANSGNVVSGEFHIPEWWAPDGEKAHVLAVVVDLDYDAAAWANVQALGGDPSSVVGFTMTVDALNILRADDTRTSISQSWSPPNMPRPVPPSNAKMTRHRAVFRTGDQGAASGFRVNLTNMRGIQVYRVLVDVDLEVSKEF